MSLNDLNEKLYDRKVPLNRSVPHTDFDPQYIKEDINKEVQFQETKSWQEPVKPLDTKIQVKNVVQNKLVKRISFFLGGIAILFLIGGTVYKIRVFLFNDNNISVAISGPKDVPSAEETIFTLTYANNNLSTLENASLSFSYPETFSPEITHTMQVDGHTAKIIIGDVPSRTEKKVTIRGKFYGSRGKTEDLQVIFRYSLKNTSAVLEKKKNFPVTIATSPFLFEITAPLESVSDQEVEYVIDYKNTSDKQFSNTRIKLVYPEGFQLLNAEPRPSEGNNIWYIGNFPQNSEGKIVLRGMLTGLQKEYKTIQGNIGFFEGSENTFVTYGSHERQTQMVASPLVLSQTVNGKNDILVSANDVLQYNIQYENTGNLGLRDAIIVVEIDPTLLDIHSLDIKNGSYNASQKLIVWKASDVPNLKMIQPGAKGSVVFSARVLSDLSFMQGKNLTIKTVAKIDSPDIPTPIGKNKIIGSNTLLIKLQSFVDLRGVVLYADAILPNTGPIPPVVGQETSYSIHLKPINTQNNLKNARVVVTFPTNIVYRGKYSPQNENISYNERNNELIWELGTLAPTENNKRELVLQVAVTPAVYEVGRNLTLMNTAVLSGEDTFTGEQIKKEKTQINLFSGQNLGNLINVAQP